MKLCIVIFLCWILTGCFDDRYRYACQDPAHFKDEQCQHPACEFSQTCTEYLVAPILEKKIEGNPSQAPVQQQCTSQCR